MPNILTYSKPIIFVDDTNLIVGSKYYDILQINIQYDLFSLTYWVFSNKLTLGKKKKVSSIIFEIRNRKRS